MPANSQVQAVTKGLLEGLGLLAVSDADAGQQLNILRALNNALNQITNFAPASWYRDDETGVVLPAPSTVSIAVTANSTAFTSSDITASKATMGGQSILIDGDSFSNRIVRNQDGTLKLMMPFGGATGTTSATIYYDTIAMPSNFRRMKGSLRKVDGGTIMLTDSPVRMRSMNAPTISMPSYARLISRNTDDGFHSSFLQVDALPPSSIRLFFEYNSRPASVAALTDDRNDLVPAGYEDSVLLAIAMKSLMSITPAIKIDPQAVMSSASDAVNMLAQITDAEGYVGRPKMQSAYAMP